MADCNHAHDEKHNDGCSKTPAIRVRFGIKAVAFVVTVLCLSWFFEGFREVQRGFELPHVAMLLGGTVSTILLITLQAYWIYVEEKVNGRLKRRIEFFEKIYGSAQSCVDVVQKPGAAEPATQAATQRREN